MSLIKGITFDLEGTIVNLEKYHYKAHLLAARKYGINISLNEAIKKIPNFIGGPDKVVAKKLSQISGNSVPPKYILESKQEYFNNLFSSLDKIETRKGFFQTFNWLKKQKFEFAIGTVTEREIAVSLLQKINLINEFNISNLVTIEDVSRPKPAPEVYLKTANKLLIKPNEQLIFEDSLIGAKAAIDAGSKVIVIPILKNEYLVKSFYGLGIKKIIFDWEFNKIKKIFNNINAT